MDRLHLLHVFPTFETGGAQMRTVCLMNALARKYRHTVLAVNGNYAAGAVLNSGVVWEQGPAVPDRRPWKAAAFFRAQLRQRRPDLLLTYNWGAMDAQFGNLLPRRLCPALHVEDGFGPDEARGLKARRVWTRRVILPRIHKTVMPSRTLWRIAREIYRLPENKVELIPNGIDTVRFTPNRNEALRAELGLPPETVVLATVGTLRPEKDLGWLLARFKEACLPATRLIIIGDGPCRAALEQAAHEAGIAGQTLFAGAQKQIEQWLTAADIFVMSSVTEQMPLSLLEAMACGLPALCTNVGDTAAILNAVGAPEIHNRDDERGYVESLRRLAAEAPLRAELGAKNRARAEAEYCQAGMVGHWDRLWREATRR
jgi:glycosyltransferase involved in cell wall biosynthesis